MLPMIWSLTQSYDYCKIDMSGWFGAPRFSIRHPVSSLADSTVLYPFPENIWKFYFSDVESGSETLMQPR